MADLSQTFTYNTYKTKIMYLTNYPSSTMTGAVGTITAADDSVLQDMFCACVADVAVAGSRYSPETTVTKSDDKTTLVSIAVKFTMPSNWDSGNTDSALCSMEDYVRNVLTARWFAYTNREDVEKYQSRADAALIALRMKLNMKVKPSRNN